MRKLRFFTPVGFLLLVAAFSAVVMLLWNWLMPSIFGLVSINFWQAAGLFVLARILLGGFGFGGGKAMMAGGMQGRSRNPIHRKWMQMTPEQREEFIHRRRKHGHGHHFGRDRYQEERQDEQGNGHE